ncbi:MAG: response regulator transcription factor [Spirochaetia bacterium]|nr:response regulator transcription factor [Spirochaetia bacterium]
MINSIDVFIIDDHAIVRQGLRSLFERTQDIHVIGEASSIQETNSALRSITGADVVLMDLHLNDGDGSSVISQVRFVKPEIKILILSGFIEKITLRKARQLGIDGYILKDSDGAYIIESVREIAQGKQVFDPEVQCLLNDSEKKSSLQKAAFKPTLGLRERQVMASIAQGKLNKEIADELSIAEKSVRNITTSLFRKLGVSNRTEAAILFREETKK